MVKFSVLFPVLIFYQLTLFAQPGLTAAQSATGNTYAIIVGITNYQDPIIKSLDYSDKDAILFAGYLKSKAGGAVPDEHIRLITNEEATIASIYEALDWVQEKVTKNDLVYFYFSGHGDVEIDSSNISRGFLLAYNSPPNNYINNAVSVEHINAFANSLTVQNAAKLILITDACRSGKLAGDYYKGKQLTAENLRAVLNNQVRMASCAADELAAEGPFWGNGRGVFSFYLLRGLYGLADLKKDGIIKLEELETFLDSSFKRDKDLNRDNHKQHPVFDGSPLFPMAAVDSVTALAVADGQLKIDTTLQQLPNLAGLFVPLSEQPIDYFFSLFDEYPFNRIFDAASYIGVGNDSIPLKIVADMLAQQKQLDLIHDSLELMIRANSDAQNKIYTALGDTGNLSLTRKKNLQEKLASLSLHNEELRLQQANNSEGEIYLDTVKIEQLKNQLARNKSIAKRFVEKFINAVHEKAQAMINAYLKGDVVELEKRQYHYSGKRSYGDLLPHMQLAMQLIPGNHRLSRLFQTQYTYISGLTARMKMAISSRSDSLLHEAFNYQYRALQMEPYAAYIHNELGNLYLHKKDFDSARHHYNLARILSPTWAIPWSNFIRLNLAVNNLDQARQAIQVADSLQPNLAYVNINAGLIMEKEKNWLATESYYLNAIVQNDVHYLPLERLGKIYITTGEYAKADSFLYEAKKRKDEFAVNEQVFRFGIELGGDIRLNKDPEGFPDCTADSATNDPAWQNYSRLLNVLMSLQSKTDPQDNEGKIIGQMTAQPAGLALAYHYWGRKYFDEGNWKMAEAFLKKAIAGYLPEAQLRRAIEKDLSFFPDADVKERFFFDSKIECLVNKLTYFGYDELENHYMLGMLYEKQGLNESAIEQYKIVSAVENERLMDQSAFKGNYNWDKYRNDKHLSYEFETRVAKYGSPVQMGGSLKLATLYEEMGELEKAENILLQQVFNNRKAGYARQIEMDKGRYGPVNSGAPFNYYWLYINRDFEALTYNFYKRVLTLFPRESNWFEKAGLFLYNRLYLTYRQISVPERPVFYQFSKTHAYPYAGSDEGAFQFFDENNMLQTTTVKYKLPGSGEEIQFELLNYDPLMEALSYLQKAVKLSGDVQPRFSMLERIADLQSWMGKYKAAIESYNSLVQRQPENTGVRNKLIEILTLSKRYPAASEQLMILYGQGRATVQQQLALANYKLLAKQTDDAVRLLKSINIADSIQKNRQMLLHAKANWLAANPGAALLYLKDSVKELTLPEGEYYNDEEEQVKDLNNARLYSIARMYACLNQKKPALTYLKTAIDSGFNYRYVVGNDEVWNRFRNSKSWKRKLKTWNSGNMDELYMDLPTFQEKTNYNPVHYRIPKLQPGDD